MTTSTIKKLTFIIFLLILIQNSFNELKDANLEQTEFNNSLSSFVKKNIQQNKINPKEFKLTKLNKRINDLKLNERTQICAYLKHLKCDQLPPECLSCNFNLTCVYGTQSEATCRPLNKNTSCEGPTEFTKTYTCAYCYQLSETNYTCSKATSCKPYSRYLTNCTVDKKIFCLGNRKFHKFVKCQLKSNIKWNYAFIFSVTLGGFGMDRFYLGNWQEGFGKLFSFGGLGFWTLIDVILIWVGYLKPSDGNYA